MPEPVIEAIIDQEIAFIEHMENVVGRLDVTKRRLRLLARRVYLLRTQKMITRAEARRIFIAGFVALALAEYAHDIPKIKGMTDEHVEKQFDAVKKLDKRLSKLPPIRSIEIKTKLTKAREDAKAKT